MSIDIIQFVNDTVESILKFFYGYLSLLWNTLRSPVQGPIKAAKNWDDGEADQVISPIVSLFIPTIILGLLEQGNIENAIGFMLEDITSDEYGIGLLFLFFILTVAIDFTARLIYLATKRKIAQVSIRNALIYQFSPFFIGYFAVLSLKEWATEQGVLSFIYSALDNADLVFGVIYVFCLGAMLIALFGVPEKIGQKKVALFFYTVFVGFAGSVILFSIYGVLFTQVMQPYIDRSEDEPFDPLLYYPNTLFEECIIEDGELQAIVLVENTAPTFALIKPEFEIMVLDATIDPTTEESSADIILIPAYPIQSSFDKIGGKYLLLPPGETGSFTLQAKDGYYDLNDQWHTSWKAHFLEQGVSEISCLTTSFGVRYSSEGASIDLNEINGILPNE